MDNKAIANIFYETADLMKVASADPFRIRSYERAAEALEGWPQQVASMAEKEVLDIPGIGKGMAANIRQLIATGKLDMHQEMLQKFRPSMLELLKISGLGPKTIALIWDAFKICDVEGVAKLASEGKLRTLPRLSEKSEQKILKSIENYRQLTGRFLLNTADEIATKMTDFLAGLPGVEKVTPAGSLRRGRETVGDLDLLVTGKCCDTESHRNAVIDRIVSFPGILEVLAKGENKVSFKLRSGMQVDVRLLPPDSFGAAMQYFTGSKNHNVQLRQRAIKQGYTLNEYGLVRVEDNKRVAGKTEEEIYKKLGLKFIPPELREDCGEIQAAAEDKLPELITQADIQGDVHMHTVETDGKCTIEEMARLQIHGHYRPLEEPGVRERTGR
jgi:DNA polymerase (family X)